MRNLICLLFIVGLCSCKQEAVPLHTPYKKLRVANETAPKKEETPTAMAADDLADDKVKKGHKKLPSLFIVSLAPIYFEN